MKTRRLLRASTLVRLGACSDQVRLFRKLFGTQVYVTVSRAEGVADKFDLDWLANRILSASALDEYARATAPARAEYGRAVASAEAEYGRAVAPAWARAYINDKEPVT